MTTKRKRKQVGEIDLTQGGLFPKGWSAIGFGWRTKKERKKRTGNMTPGHTKGENCKASPFARFCAKKSRAYKHKGYGTQLESWKKGK